MLDSFKKLFTPFLEICLFRRGPQDLPASGFLLGIVFLISSLIAMLVNLLLRPFPEAVLAVFLNLAIVIIITQFALKLYNKPMRFIQTLTAQMGAGIIISIIGVPVIVMLQYAEQHSVNTTAGGMFWLVLFIWEIAIIAHILHHALSTTFLQGSLMAILYPLAYFQLSSILIPGT